MNKDYAKNRRNPLSQSSRAQTFYASSWLWIMFGLLLGTGLAIGLYWKTHKQASSPYPELTLTMENSSGKITSQSLAKPTLSKTGEVRFDFYNLLPNMAQENSGKDSAPRYTSTLKKEPPSTQGITTPSSYIIQVGSFRLPEQAQELKAKLVRHGFEVSIQTHSIRERETWYRVYVGPFQDKTLASLSQQKLEQAHYLHSLILKNQV